MFKFYRINPSNPFSGGQGYVALSEAVNAAAFRFGRNVHNGGFTWLTPAKSEIEECIALAESLIEKHEKEHEAPECCEHPMELIGLGAAFIDLLMDRDDEKLPPLTGELTSGRIVREYDFLAALALRQCEKAAEYMDNLEIDGVAFIMWDIHELLTELYSIDEAAESLDAVSQNARKGAKARHAENHAMKAQVFEWYSKHKDEFPSMDAAAGAVAGKLVPVSFRTARDWIGQCAKQLRSAGTP